MSEKPSWLTVEMIWKGVGVLVLVIGLYYGIVHRVDALGDRVDTTNDKVIELSTSVKEIRASLPNREADKVVFDALVARVTRLESSSEKQETYVITLREKLARRGLL